ncbi:MAG: hypothetical protein HUJ90_01750, partial [Bacteroidales bacterium]|nr:hypothetical protein [Bacteroidales bacterium]
GIQSEQIVFADEQADELMLFPDDDHDIKKADFSYLQLVRMAEQKSGKHVIVHFKNFHNILAFEDGEGFLMRLERVLTRYQDVSYIFNGSHLNAMSYIFQERKYFHGFASSISIEPLARKDVMWYIERQFLKRGKEIDQKYINQIFDTCGGHPWYIMHLASICQSITIGYVSNPLIEESVSTLIAIHEARFKDYVADLTEQQRNLLRAVLDAPQHLTSAESIDKYNLVSSAHVARSRGALKKKEIVYFGAETAKVIDPLFEFWLRNCYFE